MATLRDAAHEIARGALPIVLVSDRLLALERLAATLAAELRSTAGVEVEVLPADLGAPDDLQRVADRLVEPARPVDLLINNAGFGLSGSFLSRPLADELNMLDVLVRAPLVLTHAVLPGMIERRHGAVLNISSVAGFLPRGTYGAAKSWLTMFTESLATQVEGTGVRLCVACPGPVKTGFHHRGEIDTGNYAGFSWVTPDQVVTDALHALEHGRVVTVPTPLWKAIGIGVRHVPHGLLRRFSSQR